MEVRLQLDDIVVPPERIRQNMGDIESLAKSIEERGGCIQPPAVRLVEGEYVLVAGERRLEALRWLGWTETTVTVWGDSWSDIKSARLAELEENTCRKALTPAEIKRAADLLLPPAREDAEKRRLAALEKGNRSRAKGGYVEPTQPPESGLAVANAATREVAVALGFGRGKLEQIQYVYGAVDDPVPEVATLARSIVEKWETADAVAPTANSAHAAIKEIRERQGAAPAPAPKKNRRPLPDAAKTYGWDLRKAIDRVESVVNDDRFGPNRTQVATLLRGHLVHTMKVCQDLLNRMESE